MSILKAAAGMSLVLCAFSAHAQHIAGHVLYVAGDAARTAPDGSTRPLAQGDAVFEGDLLRTGPRTHLQVAMRDQAFLGLRPDTELRLRRYGEDHALLEIVKGTLRSITGTFGQRNRAHYRIEGQHVILGIRGTDHEAAQRDEGFYDRVSEGGTYLQQPKGRLDLSPGQTGFAPRGPDGVPTLLPSTPQFLLSSAPTAALPSGPPPRDRSPLDLKLPDLPPQARFDTPPVFGPLESPGATVTGAGVGARPTVLPPRRNGKARN